MKKLKAAKRLTRKKIDSFMDFVRADTNKHFEKKVKECGTIIDQQMKKWSDKYPAVDQAEVVYLAQLIHEQNRNGLTQRKWEYIYKSLEYKRRAFSE